MDRRLHPPPLQSHKVQLVEPLPPRKSAPISIFPFPFSKRRIASNDDPCAAIPTSSNPSRSSPRKTDAASTKSRAAPPRIAPPIAAARSHPPQTRPASFQVSSDRLPASSACRASTSMASPAPPISPACQSTSAFLTALDPPSLRETNRTGDRPPGARSSFPTAVGCPPANSRVGPKSPADPLQRPDFPSSSPVTCRLIFSTTYPPAIHPARTPLLRLYFYKRPTEQNIPTRTELFVDQSRSTHRQSIPKPFSNVYRDRTPINERPSQRS
jgi:hypothetical protein